ncbi:MAG: glycosyltransferase [Candidatus Moranbacteria bacterium]|nr:glycosyltransferase [Candidatus Moranbacteria bacterium]
MRIAIDVRLLAQQNKTGIKEYTTGLLRALFLQDRKNVYILFYNSFKKQNPKELEEFEKYPNVFIKRYYYPNKLLNLSLTFLRFPKLDKLLKTKVFFLPNIIFNAFSKNCFLILTLHDLSFLKHREFFSFYQQLWHFLINPGKLIQRADRLVTVSQSSKNDIVNFFNKSKIRKKIKQKTKVIYPGISKDLYFCNKSQDKNKRIQKKYKLPPKGYILALGTLEPRKNLNSIILAFNYLKKAEKIKQKLVIVGSFGWLFKETEDLIQNSSFKKDIKLIGQIKDKERKHIYSNADVFVYPSYYEGFGFPPLEALACKTPVICSHSSSLAEVVGREALYVNPYALDELVYAIKIALNNRWFWKKNQQNKTQSPEKFNQLKASERFKLLNYHIS